MQQIAPSQLAQWAQAQTQRPVLLDVREGWEVQTACAKPAELDFVHMPMHTVPARMTELDRQRPIACMCHHGGRSMQVAQFLSNQGFEVVNISGGINAWAIQVDPTVPMY